MNRTSLDHSAPVIARHSAQAWVDYLASAATK